MSGNDWEALPQRRRKRRPTNRDTDADNRNQDTSSIPSDGPGKITPNDSEGPPTTTAATSAAPTNPGASCVINDQPSRVKIPGCSTLALPTTLPTASLPLATPSSSEMSVMTATRPPTPPPEHTATRTPDAAANTTSASEESKVGHESRSYSSSDILSAAGKGGGFGSDASGGPKSTRGQLDGIHFADMTPASTAAAAAAIASSTNNMEENASEYAPPDEQPARNHHHDHHQQQQQQQQPRHTGASFSSIGKDCSGAGDEGEAETERGRVGEGDAIAARHAAVATAVEARSRMSRVSGGLEGGAGTDGANFEYLDHTADVQLHSWGDSIERAMEGALAAMFNVITDIGKIAVDPSLTRDVDIKGHDAKSLMFALLDEFLFLFHAEGLVVAKATVISNVDRESWTMRARAEGETFDMSKHPQGTEIKAITYSNMQINEDLVTGYTDIYVIVDI